MGTTRTRYMIAPLRLLGQDVARWASLDVVRLSPFFGESFLLCWVAPDSPLLAGHTLMRLFVTRGTDLGKARRAFVELFSCVALVDLGAIGCRAVLELLWVGLDVRREDNVDQVIEPLRRQVSLDNGD